jgi:hypothetical protein
MESVNTATIDTNVLPADDLIQLAKQKGINVKVVSATHTEMSPGDPRLSDLEAIPETGVFGQSQFGICVFGGGEESSYFESVLQIITNGSFPKPGQRDQLNDAQRNQLRDAMILCSHARERRDIFVTDDRKGFIKHGRRDSLERILQTCIMTREEFRTHLEKK